MWCVVSSLSGIHEYVGSQSVLQEEREFLKLTICNWQGHGRHLKIIMP